MSEVVKKNGITQFKSIETFCKMEEDIKKWFLDQHESGCNIIELITEQFFDEKECTFKYKELQQEILKDKICNQDYFNQAMLEVHQILIQGERFGMPKINIKITNDNYRAMAKYDITSSMDEIFKQFMFDNMFECLFYKWHSYIKFYKLY